jgi:hypothetical protein
MSEFPTYMLLSLVMLIVGFLLGVGAMDRVAKERCDEIGLVQFSDVYYTCGKRQ